MNSDAFVQPISRYFRTRRMHEFARLFKIDGSERIIDIGGRVDNWKYIPHTPDLVLLNVDDDCWVRGRISKVRGDGCALDYQDALFDISYSNSVIEHVGSWSAQEAFAREVRRVAPRYYVQTPYKHFPIEPHFLAPFLQYAPKEMTKRIVRWFTIFGWLSKPSRDWIDEFVDQTRLLTKVEFRTLFPDAVIVEERFLGLTKSLIAVRL